jgi:hypothetical protein
MNERLMTTQEEISEYEASGIDKFRAKEKTKKSRAKKRIITLSDISENQPVQTKEELRMHFPELDSKDIKMLLDLSANGSEGDIYCRKNFGIKSIFRVNEERRIEKVSSRFDMTEGEINKLIMREFLQKPSVCFQCKGSLASGCVEWSSKKYCRKCGAKKFLTFLKKMYKELPPAERERLAHEARNAVIKKMERERKKVKVEKL